MIGNPATVENGDVGFYPKIIPESVKSIVVPTSVNQGNCLGGEEVQMKLENIREDDMDLAQENDEALNLVLHSPAAPNEVPMYKEELVNLTLNGDCDFQVC